MKISFIQNKCHLSGVDSATKNRMDYLSKLGVQSQIIFMEHGFEEQTFKGNEYNVAVSYNNLVELTRDSDIIIMLYFSETTLKWLNTLGKPIAYECHGYGPFQYLEKAAESAVKAVIFPTKVMLKEAEPYICKDIKAFSIPNCPPVNITDSRTDTNDNAARSVLWVGRLEEKKNWAMLIGLGRQLKDGYIIRIITDTSFDRDYNKLQQIVESEKLGNRIQVITDCPYVNMHSWYKEAAVSGCYLSTSHVEAFGMTLLEAMGACCPMVLYDLEVFKEVAGDNAIYFKGDDTQECMEAIYSICEDKLLRNSIIEKQNEFFSENYDGYKICNIYISVLESIIQEFSYAGVNQSPYADIYAGFSSKRANCTSRVSSKTISLNNRIVDDTGNFHF